MAEFRRATIGRGGQTLPGPSYTSDEVFRAEAEAIFFRDWVCVGRAEQIPRPGDYLLARVVEEGLIVVRGRDGRARAFHNVCRHRGSTLCEEAAGHLGETIRCPYHAWTFGLDGRLLAARNMQEVEGFDRDDHGLYPAALAEWEGFLFACLAAEPEPFERAFAPLIGRFAAWDIGGLRLGRRLVYEVEANWKQVFENYSECYHCPPVHPELEQLTPSTSGRNDLMEGPFLGGYMTLNHPEGSLTTTGTTSRPPVGSVAGEELARVYFYTIMPNLLLSLHPDYVMAHRLEARGPRAVSVVCEWYFDPATLAAPGFDPSDAVDFWDLVNRQDWQACERAQRGVRSRAYTPGPYAHAEGLLDAFDREYLRRMARPL